VSTNLNFENHIILDKFDTWPKRILEVIEGSKKELLGYLKERVEYRHNRPDNIYEKSWCNALEIIESELQNTNFIGFHCSKLLDFEMSDILTFGLRPLEVEFSNSRVHKVHELGLIGEELKKKLLNKEEISADNRKGRICFFHTIAALKVEWGLRRLFKCWGGEAMYLNFEQNTDLQKFGTPCIVIASLKRENLNTFHKLSELIIIQKILTQF
jgi:hypothetical protein